MAARMSEGYVFYDGEPVIAMCCGRIHLFRF